ncbi:MAG: NHLP leader peptide family RiPP precursor [Nostoc sp.]|uniref:NHLP leader peptide family RiPP precursor n=1 Tax=Nostoc sp. TaxID=1180 RepID=UPI002FF90B05
MTDLNLSDIQLANPRIRGEVEVAVKAGKDAQFKQALLSNPKATLEQEFKTQFPDDLTIQVVEAQPHHFYLRLPAKPEVAETLPIEDLIQALISTEGEMAPVIARAFKDAAFKQTLLSNPKAALAQELGVELPENLVVEVVEETVNTLIVLLPLPSDSTEAELSDEDLEAVSGGTFTSVLASIGRAVAPSLVTGAAANITADIGSAAFKTAANSAAASVGRTVVAAGTAGTTTIALGATAGANQTYHFW